MKLTLGAPGFPEELVDDEEKSKDTKYKLLEIFVKIFL